MNFLKWRGWRRGNRILNLSIDLGSITIYVVSKIAGQLVDAFPVKVKSPLCLYSCHRYFRWKKVHPFELQKDRSVLLTFLTLRSKSSFLTIRLDTANFVEWDSCSINLAKSTIFSPSCLGSSVERLFVPMCSIISGFRRKKDFTKSDISSTVQPLKDFETTCSPWKVSFLVYYESSSLPGW